MSSVTALLLNALKSKMLGAPAAEEDTILLRSFVFSNVYNAFANDQAFIAIGARGSGKSAIFRKLAEEKRIAKAAVVDIKPDHYSYEMLGQVLKAELDGSWAKQAAYSVSWQYVLLITAMKAITGLRDARPANAFQRLRSYLGQNFRGHQTDPKDMLLSYLKRIESLKLAGSEVKLRELNSLYKLEEVHQQLPYLLECVDRQSVFIFIDELDKGWDGSEDARHFVAGLFQAAIEVNRLHKRFRVFISLRQELYDSIPEIYEDAQKIRNAIRYIRWDEEQLRQLAEQRLATIFEDIHWKPPESWWTTVFEETLRYRNTKSFNYFVDRTTYRPREIILFLNECAATHGNIGQQIGYETISSAEYSYSKGRTDDIAAEFRFTHPGLLEIFESFRGQTFSLSREELENHCIDIITNANKYQKASHWLDGQSEDYLIRVLWSVGFLKAYLVGAVKGNVRPGSQYVGYHQIQSASIDLEKIKSFHVHPMFRAYLGLKEKKG